MLRALQLGLSIQDMDLITIGMLNEMAAEADNDTLEYPQLATQKDFDDF